MGLKIILISFAVSSLGLIMSMLGRGGGNFYVPILVAVGFSMTAAAANSQLILMITSLLAAFVFHQHRMVDWKLVLIIDPPTDIMAFFGGYFAYHFMGFHIKTLFALLLVIAAYFMFKPIQQIRYSGQKRAGYWYRSFGQYHYRVNLWLIILLTAAGGILGDKILLKVKPNRLKKWFAYTTLAAAVFMGVNAICAK